MLNAFLGDHLGIINRGFRGHSVPRHYGTTHNKDYNYKSDILINKYLLVDLHYMGCLLLFTF